uniref:Uncharacterized protein n=1 Tax=Monodelphis domestica TaxID=13616 RepID=A0A5F8G1Z9_MONDO
MSAIEIPVIVLMSQANTSGPSESTSGTHTRTKRQPEVATVVSDQVKVKTGFLGCWKIAKKKIFKNVNGIMKPGLSAILEPTRGDKSLFLDIFAARKDLHELSDHVLITGAPQPANFKYNSDYVVQDDVLMGTHSKRKFTIFSSTSTSYKVSAVCWFRDRGVVGAKAIGTE